MALFGPISISLEQSRIREVFSLSIYLFLQTSSFQDMKINMWQACHQGLWRLRGLFSLFPLPLFAFAFTRSQSRGGHPKLLPVTQCWKFGMVCAFMFIESSVTLGCWLRREVIVLVWRRQWWFRKQKYWWWGMVELNPLTIPYFSVVYMTEKNLFEEENVI